MELSVLPPAATRPSHDSAAAHDPPPAYIPEREPLPPTYEDVSQANKSTPRRCSGLRDRTFLAVALTLVTAGIIASLAAVFTVQAKNRVRTVQSLVTASREMVLTWNIEARVCAYVYVVRSTYGDISRYLCFLYLFHGPGTPTISSG
ncbi:hypothetical protein PMIN06_011078 [Paraphaeosphaeria minitans]